MLDTPVPPPTHTSEEDGASGEAGQISLQSARLRAAHQSQGAGLDPVTICGV